MENNFKNYLEHYIVSLDNVNDKAKINFFIEYLTNYLKQYMIAETLDSLNIFRVIDKFFLFDCVEFYVNEFSPAKGVAEDFRRTIIKFCEDICNQYGIKNDFLDSVSERREFNRITKELFDTLKEIEIRECIPFADFEILDEKIRLFFNTENLDKKLDFSIRDVKSTPDFHRKLVSALALKLVIKFGLANDTIANLKVTDLIIEDRVLKVDEFRLYLNDEMMSIFSLYLKNRQLIVEINKIDINELFITRTGSPYLNKNGYYENGKLFALMKDVLGHIEVTGLRYRTISELLIRGANINLLSQLTKVEKNTILGLCIADKSNLENIFRETNSLHFKHQNTKKNGQLRCPYCGNYWDASSENWILIQIAGNNKKYLACRKCRGLDGKYRY